VNAVAPGLIDTPWTADWDIERNFVTAVAPFAEAGRPRTWPTLSSCCIDALRDRTGGSCRRWSFDRDLAVGRWHEHPHECAQEVRGHAHAHAFYGGTLPYSEQFARPGFEKVEALSTSNR